MGLCANFCVLLVAIIAGVVYTNQPLLHRVSNVANSYGAKVACSIVFVGNRTLESALNTELVFPPIRFLTWAELDTVNKCVEFSTPLGSRKACLVSPDFGCSLVAPGLSYDPPKIERASFDRTELYPLGDAIDIDSTRDAQDMMNMTMLREGADALFASDYVHARALLVIKNGVLVYEQYENGLDESTKHIGWSMTKSWLCTIIGRMIKDGLLPEGLDTKVEIPEWKNKPEIDLTIRKMLKMQDGLDFDEIYLPEYDAPHMIFVSPTVAMDGGRVRNNGKTCYQYSSYTTNLLSRFLLHVFKTKLGKTHEDYLRYPFESFFNPLGMQSALIETDPSGIFVGSSFGWATARDWGRFGTLYLNDGVWKGEKLLPDGWTDFVREVSESSRGVYGAHFWQNANEIPKEDEVELKRCDKMYPSRLDPSRDWIYKGFPQGSYFASGFEGQLVVVVPQANAVIVKLAASKELVVEGNDFFYDRTETIRKITHSVLNVPNPRKSRRFDHDHHLHEYYPH